MHSAVGPATAAAASADPASAPAQMLLDGELVAATGGATYVNVNPATEEVLGETADAALQDMDRAIAAARRAFDETSWPTDRELRAHCLRQLHAALVEEQESIRAELVAEVGTPLAITHMGQLDWPLADALPSVLDLMDAFPWERSLPDTNLRGPSHRVVWREPVGVVAAIAPWNFPFEIALSKLGPALAAGNTVVLKPAPDTPWNAVRIGRVIAQRTDIPPGVVNVIPCSNNEVAGRLLDDPRVDMVSFTGSTAVGKLIVERSAATMKRTLLELGGKSALLVLADADLPTVLPRAAAGSCLHAGQGCALLTRVLVPRGRYREAEEILAQAITELPYGDPTDPRTISGPQINARQRDRVLDYIEIGRAEGARVAAGGGRPEHLPTGFYVQPTLLADVENTMRIAREEIFGPVLCLIPYDDEDDAVRLANDSPYGLSAGVVSASDDRAMAFARRLRVGTLAVNGGNFYGADGPFGGFKASGLGRQGGLDGFSQYTEAKTVGFT